MDIQKIKNMVTDSSEESHIFNTIPAAPLDRIKKLIDDVAIHSAAVDHSYISEQLALAFKLKSYSDIMFYMDQFAVSLIQRLSNISTQKDKRWLIEVDDLIRVSRNIRGEYISELADKEVDIYAQAFRDTVDIMEKSLPSYMDITEEKYRGKVM